MKPTCPVCGKEFWCDYPNQWVFKRNGQFICSWACIRLYDKGKEGIIMENVKTEKKRPGRKPGQKEQAKKPEAGKEEVRLTVEAEKVNITETPAEEYEVTAIRKKGIGEFYYDHKFRTIDWRSEIGEEVSMTPADWKKLAEEIPKILRILNADAWEAEDDGH